MKYGAILNQQFDGFTKDETLDDTTRTLLGLPTNATPNDAFQALYLQASGQNVFNITVHYPDGTPWPNLELNGVTNLQGGPAVTDAYGTVLATSESASPTVSFNVYNDIQSFSQQINKDQYIITYVTLDTQVASGFEDNTTIVVTSSTTYNFSRFIDNVDITAVGGGAGGSGGGNRSGGGGLGGGGGYVTTQLGIDLQTVGNSIQFNIGSGGKGGNGDEYSGNPGSNGTATTVVFSGGNGLTITANPGMGRLGNGTGGAREDDDGTDGSGYIFNESSRGVAGGGGGGAGTNDSGNYGGLGGEPYGGRGDGDNVSDNNATGPGGGGGGGQEGSSISHGSGSISYGDGTNGGNGYRGQAWMRIHRS